MTPEVIIDVFRQAMFLVMLLTTAIIAPGLLVGLVISILQAATQINEQSLSFIPRLMVTFLTLLFLASWILKSLIAFTRDLMHNIIYFVG